MKTIKILKSILFIAVLSFLASCGSDDDAIANKVNQITADNQTFKITNATMFNEGTFNGITEFDLYFTDSGITINDDKDITGKGDFLYLRLFSSQENELTAGKYLYNNQDNFSFLLNRATHFFEFESSKGDGLKREGIDIDSGSISVALENNIYTITLKLIDENGKAVTGYYKGTLKIVSPKTLSIL